MKITTWMTACLLGGTLAMPAWAQATSPHQHEHEHAHQAQTSAEHPASLPWVAAEIRKIDTAQGKVTLRHAEIPNLSMDPMTMIFNVAPTVDLNAFKVGDAVKFQAERQLKGLTVIAIENDSDIASRPAR